MVLTLGRAEPITMAEHIFGLLAMVMMGCIYAYAIASVCGILATMDPASTEFRNTKDLIKTWAAEVHMPDDLKDSMLLYIDESQSIIRQRFYGTVLELLSPALRGAASQHIAGELLRNVAFLLCDDDAERCAFTSAISQKLVLRVFAQGEHIVSADDPADALYVIVKGLVAQARLCELFFLLLLFLVLLLVLVLRLPCLPVGRRDEHTGQSAQKQKCVRSPRPRRASCSATAASSARTCSSRMASTRTRASRSCSRP